MNARRPERDPWWAFVGRAQEESGSAFYFEKGGEPGRPGRFALYGFRPDRRAVWSHPSDVTASEREAREAKRRPGGGGWAGVLGFDAVGLLEPLLEPSTPGGSPFPRGLLDHYPRWVRHALPPTLPHRTAPGLPPRAELGPPHDTSSPEAFARSVERLREAIYDGEAFQVVLAHRRERVRRGDLLSVVDLLRRHERYAYLYYLRFADLAKEDGGPFEVVGASPESVVQVRGGQMSINPIAGTRPLPPPTRGPRARLPLDKDPKELAEHRMLVDLARNDIGRVAEVGTVRLVRREVRVPYARLEHLVSRVVGHLPPGTGALQALRAAFPAGTVSGAPKIRATELLRREERTWRGPYGGAVGVLADGGDAEFALAIRSLYARPRRVYTAAGAGIVHLSQPLREWEETVTKLDMIERALTGRLPPRGRSPGRRLPGHGTGRRRAP